MNSTTKSDVLRIFTSDVAIHAKPEVNNNPPIDTCVFIDGPSLIQILGKPAGCRIFVEHADVFAKSVFGHFDQGASRVAVAFD